MEKEENAERRGEDDKKLKSYELLIHEAWLVWYHTFVQRLPYLSKNIEYHILKIIDIDCSEKRGK